MKTTKYSQISALYNVFYFISIFNIIGFSIFYGGFHLDKFYDYIGIPRFVIAIIVLLIIIFELWEHEKYKYDLKNETIDITKLKKSIYIKLIISIVPVSLIIYPYLVIKYDFNNKLTLFFNQYLPTLATKFYIDIIKPIFTLALSGLILILQKIIVTPIYDYFIKPKIENIITKYQKKDKEKQE